MADLSRRTLYLRELINKNRLFEAAIILDDIQKKIMAFDPRDYFPALFSPMYRSISPIARQLFTYISEHSNNLEWNLAKRMYDIDPVEFIKHPIVFQTAIETMDHDNSRDHDNRSDDFNNFSDEKTINQPLFSEIELESSKMDLEINQEPFQVDDEYDFNSLSDNEYDEEVKDMDLMLEEIDLLSNSNAFIKK
jgi:hypothetical protein